MRNQSPESPKLVADIAYLPERPGAFVGIMRVLSVFMNSTTAGMMSCRAFYGLLARTSPEPPNVLIKTQLSSASFYMHLWNNSNKQAFAASYWLKQCLAGFPHKAPWLHWIPQIPAEMMIFIRLCKGGWGREKVKYINIHITHFVTFKRANSSEEFILTTESPLPLQKNKFIIPA